jgi:predicted DNA-binding transcriptional regulator AlpA
MMTMPDDDPLLTFGELKDRKGWPYSRHHTRRLIKEGKFPKPVKSNYGTENRGRVYWRESTIDAFMVEYFGQKKAG